MVLQSVVVYSQEVRIRLENCSLDEAALLQIRHSFDFELAFYARVFGSDAMSGFHARIFGTEKEYLKYSREKGNSYATRHQFIAYYSINTKEMVLHAEVDNFPMVFAHELNHAILNFYCNDYKYGSWLTEGLSEFFEDIVYIDSTFRFSPIQTNKITAIRGYLKDGYSLTGTLYSEDFYKNSDSDRNYKFSWAVIFYLYKTNPDLLLKIIRESCTTETDGLDSLYPGGIELLQADLKSFYLNYNPTE